MPEDYYTLLGVEPDASEEAILRAYRREAAEHHPDVSDEPRANETFRRLNRAKRVLTDEASRREYDRLGHDRYVDAEAGGSNSQPGDHPPTAGGSREWAGGWPPGAASLLSALFGPTFGGDLARAAAAHHATSDGRWSGRPGSFAVDLESLFEAVGSRDPVGSAGEGTSHRTGDADRTREDCPKCRGRGAFVHVIDTARGRTRRLEPCERCGGAGSVRT